jgi:actin related protein 2/3 complex subunit 3
MPAYHSKKNEEGYTETCSCAVCPLKTDLKGPAPLFTPVAGAEDGGEDIIDETLNYFRANVLFRNFEVKIIIIIIIIQNYFSQ